MPILMSTKECLTLLCTLYIVQVRGFYHNTTSKFVVVLSLLLPQLIAKIYFCGTAFLVRSNKLL